LKRLRWSPAAARDLELIAEYLHSHLPSFAESTLERIYAGAKSLKQFPEKGRPGRKGGTRELVLPRLPHVIVYSVDQNFVHLIRILHGSQEWPASQDPDK
jgi:addiction module RelE/StbE family toxin